MKTVVGRGSKRARDGDERVRVATGKVREEGRVAGGEQARCREDARPCLSQLLV